MLARSRLVWSGTRRPCSTVSVILTGRLLGYSGHNRVVVKDSVVVLLTALSSLLISHLTLLLHLLVVCA